MNDEYTPIDCGIYSVYEVAVLHRKILHLRWRQDNGETLEMALLPLDLCAERNNGEFLVARDRQGHEHRIRLDRILTHPDR